MMQLVLVATIVAGALVYLGLRAWRLSRARRNGSVCSSCPAARIAQVSPDNSYSQPNRDAV